MHETKQTQLMATGTWMAAISQHFNGHVSRSCPELLVLSHVCEAWCALCNDV